MKRILLAFMLLLSGLSSFSQLNTDHYFYIARSRIYFGNYVSAIENFNIVIKLRPYLPEPYFYRGMAKLYIDDFRGAKADFDKAIRLDPSDAIALNSRGIAKGDKNDYDSAIADFDEAIRLNPAFTDAFGNVALLFAHSHS